MAQKKPKLTENKIRESLENQLKDKGADVAHFLSDLDQYMFYWRSCKKNMEDYEENGKMIEVRSASGNTRETENPALKQASICTRAMLEIRQKLGLTTDSCRPPADDGGDLG